MIITTDKVMRERDPNDFYPTPVSRVTSALDLLPYGFVPYWILDPGCGDGVWGRVAKQRWFNSRIDGVETRDVENPPGYEPLYRGDFRTWDAPHAYDLVIGNPPYKHTEPFVRLSLKHLRDGGYLLFLLRLSFLEGQARGRGLWRQLPPRAVYVCSARTSFMGNGKSDATAYAVYLWQKGWHGVPTLGWV